MITLLSKYQDVFSKNDFNVGSTDIVFHRIELTDNIPCKQSYCKIPLNCLQEVRDHLQELLEKQTILSGFSLLAALIVLVRKKCSEIRLRQLANLEGQNEGGGDAYPLP